jgi:hypothetical protein
MVPHIQRFIPRLPGSWSMAALFAIAAGIGNAQAATVQVGDYRPVFQECRKANSTLRLAIRRMEVGGLGMMLTVDPATLATELEQDEGWSCADTDDRQEKDTRYIRAVRLSCAPPAGTDVIANGGLTRAPTTGAFITGDLCPSHRRLDRAFLESLETKGSALPVALAISGTWLTRHQADFQWLRDQEHAVALRITWVDHSYDHPFVPGRPPADNFLLTPGTDMRAEILDTEKLLIANGETPSVFFRFPGLISSPALMRVAEDFHLIVLGADAWLAKSPRAKPGDIILVHLNGNEPVGLAVFADLLAAGKLPKPFRPIEEAP